MIREGDHLVIDVELVHPAFARDVVLGPSVTGGYGVDRVVRATFDGNSVHLRIVPRREFTSAQIEIPTRCAAGTQITIASVMTGLLYRLQTLPSELQVQIMEQ